MNENERITGRNKCFTCYKCGNRCMQLITDKDNLVREKDLVCFLKREDFKFVENVEGA